MVRAGAARALRIPDYGLHVGARADLVILDTEHIEDALRLQATRRWVIHAGQIVAETQQEQRLRSDEFG